VKVVALGDTHHPWANRECLDAALGVIERFQPDAVVQIGDLYDLYSFSRYAGSMNLCTPKEELTRARSDAEAMWKAVQSLAPKAACYQIHGNHDSRIFKMVASKAPQLEAVLDMLDAHSLWRFDGVETTGGERDELELDGNLYIHGYRKMGEHLKYFGKNVVLGHLHKGYVIYQRYLGETRWEMNCGYLAQSTAPVMAYTSTKTSDSTTGLGIIDGMGPRFIALG
jgi:predicted MPP superfamily phosphohydrolase